MYRPTLIYIVLFLATFVANAQIIPFKNYTVREGLPSNYVSDIVQDPKGYMWMTTDNGLARFDGYTFEYYTIDDGLSDNFTNCLTVDSKGNMWVGTETGGVNKVNDWGVEVFDETNGLFSGAVDLIFTDNENNIWACAREDGVSVFKKDTIVTFTTENSKLTSNVFCHHIDPQGNIWLGTYNGIYFFRDELIHIDHPLLEDLIVWDIITDQYNRLWIASQDNGVFCYDGDSVIAYDEEKGLTSNITLSLIEDERGRILVGTYDGGINVIQNSVVSYEYFEDTEDYWIWELTKDSNNRIWARTDENGVILIEDSKSTHLSLKNNLVSRYILKLFEDDFNNVWFTSKDGISVYGKSIFQNYTSGFIGDNKNIMSIYINENKVIHAGTYSGMTILRPDNEIHFSENNGLPEDASTFKIIPDQENTALWLATNGLSKLKNNAITHYPIIEMTEDDYKIITLDLALKDNQIFGATEIGVFSFNSSNNTYYFLDEDDGLINNFIYSLAIDKKGLLWCGSTNGLSIYDGSNFHNYTVNDGLPNNFCNDIYIDTRGVAWIATDYGLCSAVLDKNFNLSTRNYNIQDGLSSNSIASICSDNQGNIWVGHDKGVDRLNIFDKTIKKYGYLDGFMPIECNLGAIDIDAENNIWFGTIDGVVRYIPDNDINNTIPSKTYIKSINLYNDTSKLDPYYTQIDSASLLPFDLQLHYSKNNIYFDFIGLHYTIVEKNRYQYRLLGYENEWSSVTSEIQSPPYRKLPHGNYTFQVRATNCDGVWTETPAEFSFEILPPFWKTWWFRVIEVVTGILLIYLLTYLRVRKLRYDKKVLQQKVKERTIEIEKQKDQIEEQRDKISRQKKEITDSILYAKHIQSAILPKDETIAPLLKDYFILYKPRDIVSGDFYWIHGNDEKVIVLAADCTGHGVPGAFMSMLGVSILNEIATGTGNPEAGKLLDSLREHVISTLSHSEKDQEARDGMDLALCIIDYTNYTLQYAGAYNPLNIIRNKETMVFKADKMPVGLHTGEIKNFTTHHISIQKNDCLYMYSDGYADQFGGPEGKKFKSGAFKKLLLEIEEKSMNEQKAILDNTITDWMKGHEQIDDILVMGIRIV